MDSLRSTGIDLTDVEVRVGCANQSAYIVIDQSTGERTVFWSRPDCLALDPDRITAANIACARMLHIDGHDTPAVEKAARVAREHGIPVSCDVDTTGAGDVFHGAFCYSVIKGMSLRDGLEFSCAMAALNCTQLGARGGIVTAEQARSWMATAERRVWSEASRV
jgi:sugar/nucleoside kinase (ribokinase family)